MNSFQKFLVFTIIALSGIMLTMCNDDKGSPSSPPGGSVKGLTDVRLQNYQVYNAVFNGTEYTFTLFEGNISFSVPHIPKFVTTEVAGGKLKFNLGKQPANEDLMFVSELVNDLKDRLVLGENSTISAPATKCAFVSSIKNGGGHELMMGNISFSENTYTYQHVFFIYVEKDVDIKADSFSDEIDNGITYKYTINSVDLQLEKGWNILCYVESTKITPNIAELTGIESTYSLAFASPTATSYKWIRNVPSAPYY